MKSRDVANSLQLNPNLRRLRVAIVHYWFVAQGGGERVVEAIGRLFPQADLFALIADPRQVPASLQGRRLKTSFLQHIPASRLWYRRMLPLFPIALEQFDLSNYDLVISSESGPAKGVLTSSATCHICYCHSPMRYIWDMYPAYRRTLGALGRSIFGLSAHYVRLWDIAAAQRVDHFVANSFHVASRVRKHYGRLAEVIYPPVDVASGYVASEVQDYYLVVGRLVDYKRVDLAIRACSQLGRRLRVIGDGPAYRHCRSVAGPAVEFLGRVPPDVLRQNYAHCRAVIFPAEEDFGIVPVEANSYGRPVIAFARGGVLESLSPLTNTKLSDDVCPSGIFFHEQSVAALVEAVREFETCEYRFVPVAIRGQAMRFDTSRFLDEFATFVASKVYGSPTPSLDLQQKVACPG